MNNICQSRFLDARVSGRETITIAATATALTAGVFFLDTFTSNDSAVAVLYVIAIILWGDLLKKLGFWLAALGVVSLTLVSFFATHASTSDTSAISRLAVSIAAQAIAMLLVLRNHAFLQHAEALNRALRRSENRYRTIFEESRVALWERDYSLARAFLMSLKRRGVSDFHSELRRHPSVLETCKDLVRTVRENRAAIDLAQSISSSNYAAGGRLLLPDDETFTQVMEAMFQQRADYESAVKVRTASGEVKVILVSMRFPEDTAAFDRVVIAMVDVTEHEQAQRALLKAQSLLAQASRTATAGALSASLAHDLNQPLGALLLNGQTCLRWLRRQPPDLAKVESSIGRMVRDSQRACDIVQHVRQSLMDAAKPPEPIQIETLLRETRALLEDELKHAAVELEIDVAPTARVICGVRIEIQQILINLLTNAVQAMQEAASPIRRIVVTVSSSETLCTMEIRDYGPGIPISSLNKLFEPFYTTKPSGMGLGLPICRKMIEARGGQLTARNSPDGGAILAMSLPVDKLAEARSIQGSADALLNGTL